ncbi:enolase 1 [Thecamonas trahens ATCC 50062]|uniref:phosphopyruvate hydratase n=1 Tax=Thecamonas trahens ATCC 50062 TaxID=461836 RepID=A0A0L0DI76_THETB|nr:enolase 1 [Thecamonas trahens ATCC 50062]KNC51940.1 enolase 1 [Thecamonas trahens ATCC 50062]|eukprot:XP_013755533.1 enolase 1 [Thecamonas trahens ATCC 50062]
MAAGKAMGATASRSASSAVIASADIYTSDGVLHRAAVPSGASTGVHEALELRDGGSRYAGKGVLTAVANVKDVGTQLIGADPVDQANIDEVLITADGTENKGKLGANAILAVSMAAAKAGAWVAQVPLYAHLANLAGRSTEAYTMPVPLLNVINGGEHAGNGLAMQEFMLVPRSADSFADALRMGAEVYHVLKGLIKEAYGPDGVAVGDEGGFAPAIDSNTAALDLLVAAIDKAGYADSMGLAMDVAASEFFDPDAGTYDLGFKTQPNDGSRVLSGGQLSDLYAEYAAKYPIDDFANTKALTAKLGDSVQIVGDDLLVTNPARIATAVADSACNGLLLKVNQIGSVTEALEAARVAREAGWGVMVSHRSGETEDTFIADLAVGLGCGQIKTGAPARSERLAKYNQLLRIEEELAAAAAYPGWTRN